MTAVVQNHHGSEAAKQSSKSSHFANWIIPEVIEEKRKRSDGRIVSNRYAIGKLLGKGGFAKVFVGTLLPSKHDYALKIVSKASLAKDRARLKLQSEIKIHRALDQENVVKFERFFEDNTYYYLLMELCDNQAMSTLLEQRKRITEPEMRYYLRQLVVSLQYLRENLVIHRDLKLGNLFLDNQMRVKVGDFGLAAKLGHEGERKKTVCGTPNYIAPEILKSDTGHSFEVDIWSTGVIIYTLLVGKPPFQCKDVKSTYDRILSNTFSFPDHVMVSSEAKHLIIHMLQHHPHNRLRLKDVLEHPFFTASHVFTPASLPESSLRQCPHIEDLTPRTTGATIFKQLEDKRFDAPRIGDENDPNAINRLQQRLVQQPAAKAHDQHPAAVPMVSTRSATARMKAVPEVLAPRAVVASASSAAIRPKSAGPLQRRAYQQKFDIFVDEPPKETVKEEVKEEVKEVKEVVRAAAPSSAAAVNSPNCRDKQSQEYDNLRHRAYRVLKPDSTADLQQVQSGLQHVHITDTNTVPPPKRLREAWAMPQSQPQPQPQLQELRVSTPPEATKKDSEKLQAPSTIEAVHDMLSTHAHVFSSVQGINSNTGSTMDFYEDTKHRSSSARRTSRVPEKVVPQLWTVRYVDHTAKYGLGFLFNNGYAGVNFNDATKIVMSPDGKVFQYFERTRRRDSSISSEYSSARYFLDSYPAELHKKVTLLKHFRNFLLDEESNSKKDEAAEVGARHQAFAKEALPAATADSNKMLVDSDITNTRCLDDEPDMPFVKKYIKTKSAILFRLNNHTVQMCFFDKSEILLNSEAKYITYVNKVGQRSDHYLSDALLNERADIAQRLKYTKDIMYRLIHQS